MAEADKVILSRDAYPGNSAKSKDAAVEKKPREKREAVASAKRVKKSFGQRVKGAFKEGGVGAEVTSYAVHDVIVPAAKTMFADLVESLVDQLVFGGDRRPGRSRRAGSPYLPYNSMYQGGRRENSRGDSRDERRPARHDFSGVILESRAEADRVLDEMVLIIDQYNVVSVAELYELVGISAEFTDQSFGWTDLDAASVRSVRGGWSLDLPRPRVID